MSELTIVTGASSNHFSCLRNLLYTISVFGIAISTSFILENIKSPLNLAVVLGVVLASFIYILRPAGTPYISIPGNRLYFDLPPFQYWEITKSGSADRLPRPNRRYRYHERHRAFGPSRY
jgi:hypothetical protein